MQESIYDIPYYIYVLFFGVYAGMKIACGRIHAKEWQIFLGLCPALLLLQGIGLLVWDMETVRLLYPFTTHLPTVLCFVLLLKVKWNKALVSVVVSYSLCQLLRWIGLVIDALNISPAATVMIHLAFSQMLLLLLSKYCLGAMHNVISKSDDLLRWFGALPIAYYLYEYFTIYTRERYTHILALNELLPTEMVLFFVLFVMAYQRELETREQMEYQSKALEMRLAQAAHEINALRTIEENTAIYRHDLRHHMMMIDSLLAANRQEQASLYISHVKEDMDALAPIRYCDNETANLLLCAFKNKAEGRGVRMSIKASLPQELNLPDTELCTLLSNGLENAVNAASMLPQTADRFIDVCCVIKQNNLLCEIRNPYEGQITMQNGIPLSRNQNHHYGCRSIQSITQRRKGLCSFDTANCVFSLRIAIPLEAADAKMQESMMAKD